MGPLAAKAVVHSLLSSCSCQVPGGNPAQPIVGPAPLLLRSGSKTHSSDLCPKGWWRVAPEPHSTLGCRSRAQRMLLCLPGVVVSGSTGLLSLRCTQDKGHSTESGKDSAKQHSNSRFFRAPGFSLL